MYTRPSLEKYLSYANSESPRAPFFPNPEPTQKCTVTISRQSGSGAHVVAEKLAEYLQLQLPGNRPWLLFDRNFAEKVLEDNNLPQYLAKYMPEDRISAINDAIEEMFGVHPPFFTLMQKTSETILRLAQQGNVILIGRAANIITRELPYALHVRLVGSLARRIEHIQQIYNTAKKEAAEIINREDRGRERYLKKYFGNNIDDPLQYHLVINTDLVTYEQAAKTIAESVIELFARESRVSTGLKSQPIMQTSYTR